MGLRATLLPEATRRDCKQRKKVAEGCGCGPGSDNDVVGAARDVRVPPFDHQDVLALLLQLITDVVHAVTHMFDQDLLTGNLWTINADQEHVPPCVHAHPLLM